MEFKNSFFLIAAILLASAMLLTGCASTPQIRSESVFYPPLPEKPRLQFLTAISSEDDLTDKKAGLDDFLLGGKETDKSMGRPYAVQAVKGKIYLTDRVSNDLLEINLLTSTINPLRAGGRGALQTPSGLWIADDGSKYIADLKRQQVVVFDRDNNFETVLGNATSLERPVDVAVYGERVYVCDMQKHQVVVFDRITGKMLTTIGKVGEKEGEFNRPTHITVDSQGNLIVNDAFNFRIQKFAPDGKFLQMIGMAGSTPGNMARTKGVVTDHDGNLYVVDAAFENVQIFNPEGKLLLFFGGAGLEPGSMYLPAGIAVDYVNVPYFQKYADKNFKLKYLIYVCNMTGANKLNVYGFGDWLGE
ncbi:MAG: 6-bladed beta-propeller [Desulfuromonadaceae bacterium]|nr:6-bladed beta-propeller [Desulfuromonadaceae bacterium]